MDRPGEVAVIDPDGLNAQPLGLPLVGRLRFHPDGLKTVPTCEASRDRQAEGRRFLPPVERAVTAGERAVNGSKPTDRELVTGARQGDAEAFGALYDRHVAGVYAYVQLRIRDATVAEDLTHDVFASALAGLPRFRWQGDLRPWLLRLAHNRIANHWRTVARHPELAPLPDEEAALSGALVDDYDPAAAAELALDMDSLDVALAELGDLEREILALRFGGGLSVRETARTLGRSEPSVRSLQFRAVRRLAARLRTEDEQP